MDFTQRSGRLGSAGQPAAQPTNENTHASHGAKQKSTKANGLNLFSIILLFSVTILIASLALYVALGGKTASESKYVDTSKYQAVFLNSGQVYFGRITTLNDKFVRVGDIYYLRVNQQVQPDQKSPSNNDVSLVKLGCELHGPQDQMVINRDQVSFWENLKDDGQVAKAVKQYKEQNPKGQDCQAAAATTNSSTTAPATTKKP